MNQVANVREIKLNDDFQIIEQLVRETGERYRKQIGLIVIACASGSAKKTKKLFFKNDEERQSDVLGFVAEYNNEIVAVSGIIYDQSGDGSINTKNGEMLFGYNEDYDHFVPELLEKCMASIKQRGGSRCTFELALLHGQIYNEQIKIWNELGFSSDKYFTVKLCKEDEYTL